MKEMKDNYNRKKHMIIITLSVLAVCLAGGLFWYMGTLGNTQLPVAQAEVQTEQPSAVTVPEIRQEQHTQETTAALESMAQPETISEPEATPKQEATPIPPRSAAAETAADEVQVKPSVGKPKSPSEAVPPAEPPKETAESNVPAENPDEAGQCRPEADEPKCGDKQNGQIYVPGFGWIKDEGGGSEVYEAPNAGTGKPVGEM